MTKGMHGRGAEDLRVRVPQGTTVRDGKQVKSLRRRLNMVKSLSRGSWGYGRGGRGNPFHPLKNPANLWEWGNQDKNTRVTQLELKNTQRMLAGWFPIIGKSTLLSVITSAKPKIGAYDDCPKFGMVRTQSGESFCSIQVRLKRLVKVLVPGTWLRHRTRTRVITHVIDMSASEGRDHMRDYLACNRKLEDPTAYAYSWNVHESS